MEIERILARETAAKGGEVVKVSGWVASIRDHGQLLFIDLRDWSGRVQLVVNPENKAAFEVAKTLGNEYVISATGKVVERDASLANDKLETGKIEIAVDVLELINKTKPLPFPIDTAGHEVDENTRLKYRYIDLRRERIKTNIIKRHKLMLAVRQWMDQHGFTEITTPLLTSTSPEGARDFMVPSRIHKGKFYVLPQAPQQFKQLLMVGGVDKYFQIAPCARDEDPRADRHYGIFYQIDIEMSFPTIDRLFSTCEDLIKDTYKTVAPDKEIVEFPFPRIPYAESMERFGTDKPDLRFGFELHDITEIVKDKTEFNIFNSAEVVKTIVAEGCGEWSRKDIEELESYAKSEGAKGLAYAKVAGGTLDSGIGKFLEPVAQELIKQLGAKDGDLVFFAADSRKIATKVLGAVRSRLGDLLNLKDPGKLAFAWITDFPFYEMDEKTGKIDFAHNPFSMPKGGLEAFNTEDPLSIESNQYDVTLNGFEILSGSIRNHNPELMVKAFEVVGYGEEEVKRRFGGLYNAFQYGAPPHGGWAIGIDRMFMVFTEEPNIRDVYAFPTAANGEDLMMNAPNEAYPEDLEVLGIEISDKGDATVSAIKHLLDENKIEYKFMEHEPVRTSEQAAKVRGTKTSEGAKALVLKSLEYQNRYLMVVIPADKQIDLDKVAKNLGEKFEVAEADEVERYTGIKMGGVPPFGRLLKLELYFDQSMWEKEMSVFNCGRKDRSIYMKSADLIKVAQPNKMSSELDFIK